MSEIIRILTQIEPGDPQAAEQLLPLMYDELRRLAAQKLAREQPGQTLEATALVHEAYLRLIGTEPGAVLWDNRGHFFSAAAEAMRRILVDSARRRQSLKHGGGVEHQPLEDSSIAGPEPDDKVLAISEALEKLAAVDHMAAELVKLRYFAGLTGREAAAALGLAERSADRLWVYARAWLLRQLADS